VSTTKQLEALLKYDKITYDLLWALFKPKMILYITCPGTQKSRCIKYDFGEEKKLSNGIILYYSMQCRYLDFDGTISWLLPLIITERNIPHFCAR
jgi:hypothetical protein